MSEGREIDGLDARFCEMLAALSHDLRNPLNAILGWATVLTRRGDLPEPVMQGLQAIERNSRLQAKMIADLLDYVALSAGQARLAIETLDPCAAVRAAIEAVAAPAREAAVTLEASFEDESLRVKADAARLEQLIGNLLSNAVKFSERGKAVRIAAQRHGNSFRLVVSDQGKGIDPQLLPRIFQLFGRPDPGSSQGTRGLRLGLAVVKQLASLHSGAVRGESPGKGLGATFTLEFPLCDAASSIGGSPNKR
jgi:two-component system, chemotaxis family, CheB/CheR fusion protein